MFLILPFIVCAETELWFGSYINDSGKLSQARFNVQINKTTDKISTLQLAPYGKSVIDFKVVDHDLNNGFLTLEWPSKPTKKINLFKYNPEYYSGNWIDGTELQLMILKKFNGQDAEMQGNWFKPSQTEVDILTYALSLLADEKSWRRNNSRICDSITQVNLFCSLYFASEKIDGEYRHLRPAIKAVRETIGQRHPQKYDHILVDFNSAQETSFQEIRQVLMVARISLLKSIEAK